MKPTSETLFFRFTGLFGLAVAALFVLHQDLWFGDNGALVAGLPVGLLYHLGYCGLVSLVLGLFLFVRKR